MEVECAEGEIVGGTRRGSVRRRVHRNVKRYIATLSATLEYETGTRDSLMWIEDGMGLTAECMMQGCVKPSWYWGRSTQRYPAPAWGIIAARCVQ